MKIEEKNYRSKFRTRKDNLESGIIHLLLSFYTHSRLIKHNQEDSVSGPSRYGNMQQLPINNTNDQ